MLDQATVADILLRAASVRGLLHYAQDIVRQDAYALASAGPRIVCVVCDGLGDPSLPQSHVAAELAATALATSIAADWAGRDGATRLIADGIEAAAELIRQAIERQGQMATTVVVLTAELFETEWQVDIGWVGDSSCWHLGGDGQWRDLTMTDGTADSSSEFAETATDALPNHASRTRVRSFRLDGGSLFVMTDGVGKPLQKSAEVRDTLALWWRYPPVDITRFAEQTNFARRGFVDDRTVIGLWPKSAISDTGAVEAS